MEDNVLALKATIVACIGTVGTLIGWKGLMLLAWAALMLIDYLTGSFAAMKAGEWSSMKAREGAWHKCGAIIVLVVSAIADGIMLVICGNIPVLDITWPGVLLPMIAAWYILTELGSILENAVKLGANPPAWLQKILAVSVQAVNDAGNKAFGVDSGTDYYVSAAVKRIMDDNYYAETEDKEDAIS